jgi:hypothetical protein
LGRREAALLFVEHAANGDGAENAAEPRNSLTFALTDRYL